MTLEYLELMEEKNNAQCTMKNEEFFDERSGKAERRMKNEEGSARRPEGESQFAAATQDSTQKTSSRRKLTKSFKSNTRIYDDGSIEVDPQSKGEPAQKDVKKVGKSKRYVTCGKTPLTCVELKCPEDVPDKAAFFHKELAKLTKDMEIEEPQMPEGEFLLNEDNVKVKVVRNQGKVMAWLTFEAKGLIDIRRELYNLTCKIDKCLYINEASVCQQK